MKRFCSVVMLVLVILAFQSCNNNGSKDNKTTSDTTANVTNDNSTATVPTAPVVADNTPQNVHPVELIPTVSERDVKFASKATNDAINEVNSGKMALEKGTNPRVKEFATMLINDHTRLGDELTAIAKNKSITLPALTGMAEMRAADRLAIKSGADFDKAYVDAILEGQKKVVKLFEEASQNCKDADLKAFAIKTLPTLKMHLDSAQAIHDSINQ